MPSLVTNTEIIKGCKQGKRKYQDLLYQRYSSLLLGTCMRYIGNKMQAEDILHDAFIKIYVHIKKFNITDNGSFEGWMKRIAVNVSLNFLRDSWKDSIFTNIDDTNISETEPDSDIFETEYETIDKTALMKIISELPAGYNVVFNLYVFDNYSHQEIAETLGISISTSKTQLLKARKWLQKKLSDIKKKNLAISA
jgi:RNA polymerase sigma-70 factor (ECF subfamily)